MTTPRSQSARDVGGMITACVFIVLACIALWDTTTMMDSDSYVFPRAIAIALIVFSLLLILYNLIRPGERAPVTAGGESTPRRVMLVAVMLLSCFAMPWLGFLLCGMVSFGLLMMVSMYEPWTTKRRLIYPVVAVAVVAGFYTLFSTFLMVPLPVGFLFE
jgi:uncharacterized membrane protein